MKKFLNKIKRKWMKLRLQPIRVFCWHHVTEEYDASSMKRGDWKQLSEIQKMVLDLKHEGVVFISLTEVHHRLKKDWIRRMRYMAITFDDGYASLKRIVAWLMEQNIPVTLFINGKYLDGKSYRENPNERYLTKSDIDAMKKQYGDKLSIQSHGWEHTDAVAMTEEQFRESIQKNCEVLSQYNPIIFHAYTWGSYNRLTDSVLRSVNILPVRVNGRINYNDDSYIDRG